MRYKKILLGIMLAFSLALPFAAAGTTSALFDNSKSQACQGLGGCTAGADTTLKDTLRNALNLLTVIVGIFVVFMVIVSGVKFVNSEGGDSSKLKAARGTLTSALIGLVIVALSQTMVFFVLSKTSQPPCPAGKTTLPDGKACLPAGS